MGEFGGGIGQSGYSAPLSRRLRARAERFVSMAKGGPYGTKYARLLRHLPTPLINPPERFGVLWSAKGGSMAITLWFLSRLGLLEAANAYDRNPHHYRRQVLTKSPEYLGWVINCDPNALAWLRVIRDPYLRCVSSFRHMLRHGSEEDVLLRTGVSIVEDGLSFVEFLGYLGKLDIAHCNVHYRQQCHPLEQHVTPHKVVNLDKDQSLLSAFEAFEGEIGLHPLPPERRARMMLGLEAEQKRHHKRRETATVVDATTRIRRADAGGAWPDYSIFLNPETRRTIEQIYVHDFTAYRAYL